MASELEKLLKSHGGLGGEQAAPDAEGWVGGFAQSLGSALTGFWGKEEDPSVTQWNAANPVGGTIANVLGYGANLAGGELAVGKMAASKSFPQLGKFLNALGDAEKAPVLTAAVKSVAKLAPVEGARIVSSLALGEKPIEDTLGEVAFDLGTTGVITGGFKALGEYGKKSQKLSDIVKGADPVLPPQLQMRAAEEFLAKNTDNPELNNIVRNRLAQFQQAIRLEEPAQGARYVGELEGGGGKDINRLFRAGVSDNLARYKFIKGLQGFDDVRGEDGVLTPAMRRLQDTWDRTGFISLHKAAPYIQFPRVAEAVTEKGAGSIQRAIQKDMQNVADGVYISREKNGGMFVFAKKIEGNAGPGAKDRWVLFKTDTPGKFLPGHDDWAQQIADRTAWAMGKDELVDTGSRAVDYLNKVTKQIPLVNYLGLGEQASKFAKITSTLAKNSGIADVVGGAGEAFGNFANRYLTPTTYQFGKSPRANWLFGMSRAAYDQASKAAQEIMYGTRVVKGKNLFEASIGQVEGGAGSIKARLDALDQNDLENIWQAWNEQWSAEMAQQAFGQGKFSEKALDFLTHMGKIDSDVVDQLKRTQELFGEKLFTPMENHYMISRTWSGDWRIPVHNEDGNLVYMASGKTKASAERMADKIINETGRGWSSGTAMLADRSAESPLALGGYIDDMKAHPDYLEAAKASDRIRGVRKPNFMEERKNIGGYSGQEVPWSKKELQDNIMSHLDQQQKYMAKLAVHNKFGAEFHRLAAEDPNAYNVFMDRLNDLEGKPGPIGQLQNALVDKVLSPVLGKNSATKIVNVSNQYMMHFNLGALNFGQGVLNALQFTQSVIPEVAFVMNAVPARLARYYSIWPVSGPDGFVRGAMHTFDPLRVMKQSIGEMSKPSEQLLSHFGRAASDGVISPRLIEDYLGENSLRIRDLKSSIKDGNFSGWLKSLSETFIAGSEKLSRGNAFTVGHIVGRDFLGLADDQLYEFAKKFTHRTMYGYATVDRARVFTTPAGSALGLFKNWMTHYMGSMLEYTGEGLMRDNWTPLLWQLAGTTAVGGVAATGPAFYLADKFSHMASNKSLMDNTYELFGGTSRENLLSGSLNANLSDAVFFGLPTLFGLSLSTKTQSPFAEPAKDISYMFQLVYLDRMKALGKALGDATDHWASTGNSPLADPKIRAELARAVLPKTVYRTASVWEDNTIRSLNTYNPLYTDVSIGERIAYATGLDPLYVERSQRVSNDLWADRQKMNERVKAYGQAFNAAQQERDYRTMQDVMVKAMAQGVDFSRVLKSASSLYHKQNTDMINRTFSPEEIWKKRSVFGE